MNQEHVMMKGGSVMSRRLWFILCACIVNCLLVSPSIHPAWGENHVESTMETRAMVFLQVEKTQLQKWVPESMQITPLPAGPFNGANLILVFIDLLRAQDPQGKPHNGGLGRAAVFVVPVKHNRTGEMVSLVIDGLADNPENVPGPYKNFKGASIQRELNHSVSAFDAGEGSDTWKFEDSSGMLIDFHVGYKRALPIRAKPVLKIYSGADPEFFRIYKTDYLVDIVKSAPAKIDRAKEYRLKVSMPGLKRLFDGTEQLVAVAIIPAFVREVFFP
jgi:hypothetical protein